MHLVLVLSHCIPPGSAPQQGLCLPPPPASPCLPESQPISQPRRGLQLWPYSLPVGRISYGQAPTAVLTPRKVPGTSSPPSLFRPSPIRGGFRWDWFCVFLTFCLCTHSCEEIDAVGCGVIAAQCSAVGQAGLRLLHPQHCRRKGGRGETELILQSPRP